MCQYSLLKKKSSTTHSLTADKIENAHSIALKNVYVITLLQYNKKIDLFFPLSAEFKTFISCVTISKGANMLHHWVGTKSFGCIPEGKCSPSLLWEPQTPHWMSWWWWQEVRTAAAKFVLQVMTVFCHSAENNSWPSTQTQCYRTPFCSPV